MMNVLIDTCVMIDILQQREPFWNDSYKVLDAVADKKINGIVTAKALTDIYYLHHRFSHSDKESREVLLKLYALLSVADTTADDCYHAISSDISDFEDAVVVETAKRLDIEIIVTRNVKDYKNAPLKIMQPSELIKYLDFN